MSESRAEQEPGSWDSADYVAEWIHGDAFGNLLDVPRRLSAELVADAGIQVRRVVDLGSGPGTYLALLLEAFPSSTGVWVDASEAMREEAEGRLSMLDERVTYVVGDIRELGSLELGEADLLLTSRAVHHFEPDVIRGLYRDAAGLITSGGFLFNLDHFGVPGGWEESYRRVRARVLPRSTESRPHRHDVPFSPIDQHAAWLTEVGFEAPDTPWRMFYTALLAARKST